MYRQLRDFLKGKKPKPTPVMTKAERIKMGQDNHKLIVKKNMKEIAEKLIAELQAEITSDVFADDTLTLSERLGQNRGLQLAILKIKLAFDLEI